MIRKSGILFAVIALCLVARNTPVLGRPALPQLQSAIDDTHRVTLGGNTRPEAQPENDRGLVPDWLPITHMQMLLRRPAAQEAALIRTIDKLHDPGSSVFHKWLSAREFGDRFGVARQDIDKIKAWLASHHFHVEGVLPSRLAIASPALRAMCAKHSTRNSMRCAPMAPTTSPI